MSDHFPNNGKSWTDEEVELLKKMWVARKPDGAVYRVKELTAFFGRSANALVSMVHQQGFAAKEKAVSARTNIKIDWTQEKDEFILESRKNKKPWTEIGEALGHGKQVCISRGHALGLIRTRSNQFQSADASFPRSDWILPAGHPISWDAITTGTCLEGTPYPRRPNLNLFEH